MVLPFFPGCVDCVVCGSRGGEEPSGEDPPPDSNPFSDAQFGKNLASLSSQFAGSVNHRFKLQKRGQLFIRTHNETLSIAAMCVHNPDRSPVGINR